LDIADFATQVFVLKCALSGAPFYGLFLLMIHMYLLYGMDVSISIFVCFLLHFDAGPGGLNLHVYSLHAVSLGYDVDVQSFFWGCFVVFSRYAYRRGYAL
jgi:hypothetical protein